MKLKCKDCGYETEVMESELMMNTECVICGGEMVFAELYNEVKEIEKEENIANETNGINDVIAQQMIDTFKKEIEFMGEKHTWDIINSMELEQRINYIELFFEAKHQMKIANGGE